ncbi:MAG: hypothetical protein QNJ72_10130 [Pleurocapsa sp. MO_226.B13]|nr:hypothetical protein [Pleurocapsa sp. MO_226.B13]
MNKLDDSIKKLFLSHLLILSILAPAIIVKAQNNTASTSEPTSPKSTSILEAIVRLFKSPENRLITRGTEVCPISPGNLGEQVIWSDRPLFIWQGQAPQSTINLYSASVNFNYKVDEQLLWSETIPPNTQTLAYAGEKLQPGFTYDWEFITDSKTYRPTFILMEESKRQAIAADLARIEQQLQASGATEEDIAIAKADYFVNQQLWSDALQQLYIVDNSSANLKQKIKDIEQYLC